LNPGAKGSIRAPFLQGARLRLEPSSEADVPDMVRASNDPEVRRYARSWLPSTIEARNKWRAENAEFSQKSDRIVFAIKLLGEDRVIGSGSLGPISWTDRNSWFGLVIGDKAMWGKGYAVEAGALLLDYAFGELGLHKVVTGIFRPNKRSQGAATTAGFTLRGVLKEHIFVDGKFIDSFTYEMIRDDWIANRGRIEALLKRRQEVHA
jgi:ribosomal-protein-alanine N-acetyltransferase